MPQSNVIILTDPASDLPLHRDMVTIQPIQGEYSRDKLMLQRIRSYIVRAQGTVGKKCMPFLISFYLTEFCDTYICYLFSYKGCSGDSQVIVLEDLFQILGFYF